MSTIAPLSFNSDESKAFTQTLTVNGVVQDMTGWTVKLYVGSPLSLLKTITSASNGATTGQISSPAAGVYYFVLLSSDLVSLLAGRTSASFPARIQYVSPATTPPNVFDVDFTITVSA